MTKKEFFWCLSKCRGEMKVLVNEYNGWLCAKGATFYLWAKEGAPGRNSKGEPIKGMPNNTFVIKGMVFRGGYKTSSLEAQEKYKERLEKQTEKYRRWLEEFIEGR